MIANRFTKSLEKVTFAKFKSILGLVNETV